MSGINFITQNPVVSGYRQANELLDQDQQRRTAREVDAAIRRGIRRQQKERGGSRVASADSEPVGAAAMDGVTTEPLPPAAPMPAMAAADPEPMDDAPDAPGVLAVGPVISDSAIPSAQPDLIPASMTTAAPAAATAAAPSRVPAPAMRALRNDVAAQRRALLDDTSLTPEQVQAGLQRISQTWQTQAPARAAADGGGAPAGVERMSNPMPAASRPAPIQTTPPMAMTPPRMRGALAPPPGRQTGEFDAILDELAGVEGGGAAALQLLQRGTGAARQAQAERERVRQIERAETTALQALGRGDVQTFRHFAPMAGIELPDEVIQNAEARGRLATAGLLAQRHYRGNEQQAQRFVDTYLRTGDVNEAMRVAGPPQQRDPRWSQRWVQSDEQDILMFFDARNPQARGVPAQGPDGRPVTRPTTGGAGGAQRQIIVQTPDGPAFAFANPRDPSAPPILLRDEAGNVVRPAARGGAAGGRVMDRQLRLQMLIAAGVPEQEANAIAGGMRPPPSTVVSAFTRFSQLASQNIDLDTPQRQAAWTEAQMTGLFGPDWRAMTRPGGAANAPAQPAVPEPQATPAPSRPWWQIFGGGGGSAPAPAPALPPAQQDRGAAAVAPPAAAPMVPAAPPAPAAPTANGIPPLPLGVPPGSAWSPSRQMWRDPAGRLYSADGDPLRN